MADLWSKAGTGHVRALWPVLVVFLLAVLVPTVFVLWFMVEAVRNERLAVRGKLEAAYSDRLGAAEEGLEDYWSAKAAALEAVRGLSGGEAFASLATGGVADGVVVFDVLGRPAYPAGARVPPDDETPETPAWQEAESLEYELNLPADAAQRYARIAIDAAHVDLRARALQARARCLVKAGLKQEALEVLTGPLAAREGAEARDGGGRLIALNATLQALRLLEDRESGRFGALAAELAGRLADYGGPPMPAGQRRFLMRALCEVAGGIAEFPTLGAEDLAAEYLGGGSRARPPLALTRAKPEGLWQFTSADGRITALFRHDDLVAELEGAAGTAGAPERAVIRLAAPGTPRDGREAFLTGPTGPGMPGWKLEVFLVGEDPFAAAAGRQVAAYLWTGFLGVFAIAVLAFLAAGYLGRQLKLARLKNDLIATVSHELRTPLASMRVLIDTLLDGRVDDERQAQEYFRLIAGENERLSRLVDNFLTFSRMQRGVGAFEFAEFRVEEALEAAVDLFRDGCSRPGCRLEVDVAGGLPAVTGDRDAIVTVLLNLLDNAYKYSGDEKEIVLRACGDDGWVSLAVSDNGIGLSRRERKRVFGRFYQADRGLSRNAGGCGLGLSIVKFIVDAHGGSVEVKSRQGEGSTFTVRLPAVGPSA